MSISKDKRLFYYCTNPRTIITELDHNFIQKYKEKFHGELSFLHLCNRDTDGFVAFVFGVCPEKWNDFVKNIESEKEIFNNLNIHVIAYFIDSPLNCNNETCC